MISVILYGRNDAHGYNLHRRAALSLNCIAEVLTDPDDELIFVDYNTPDELPTFIEAISDTLTERCLGLLRVLRVRARIHQTRFAARTHLPAIEPVARNAAARRANPSNRWILSTNTDMIFVPIAERSLSEICGGLPDGFYGLPRFELPEWLWERLPRTDPRRALSEIGHLGPGLRLDESTLSHEWIRFDAPGDFQLILRDDFLAIDGFDEQMLLGYHVDSNMSRRLLLHRGSIESAEHQLAGYHCNHNRTRTVYHGSQRVENDLQRFFFSIHQPDLPAQRTTWGLPDAAVEEVPVRDRVTARAATALIEAIPAGPRTSSDAWGAPFVFTYDSGHVLPFIADTLVLSPVDAIIGYIGANKILEEMLEEAVKGLGLEQPLAVSTFDDAGSIDELARRADVFIIDLGLDVTQREAAGKGEFARFPPVLADALVALHLLVELERARYEREGHPRPMVLVNSSSGFWDPYVIAQFDCSYTTVHSRVRRATVKLVPERDVDASRVDVAWANRLMRWFARDKIGGSLMIRPDESIVVADLEDYSGFGGGWTSPEETGVWTEGERSELKIGVGALGAGEYALSLWLGMICIGSDQSLRVDLRANGGHLASRELTGSFGRPWQVDLPANVVHDGEVEMVLAVDDPTSPAALGWSTDDRRLGVHIRTLTLKRVDRSLRLRDRVDFALGSDGERFLGDGWSSPEEMGVWTLEETARVAFRLVDATHAGVELVLDAVPFVTAEHREVEVEVWMGDDRLVTQMFRYREPEQPMRIGLPGASTDATKQIALRFRVREPARPVDLGLGSDPRRLGIYLRSFTVVEPGSCVPADRGLGTLGKLRQQLSRSLRS